MSEGARTVADFRHEIQGSDMNAPAIRLWATGYAEAHGVSYAVAEEIILRGLARWFHELERDFVERGPQRIDPQTLRPVQ